MQQLVEEVEVDGKDSVSLINAARANHNASRFVEEAECVDPMRWFSARSSQEERNLAQDATLDVFSALTVETRQNSHHRVDGMTLDFLARIAKLVDYQVDQLIFYVNLAGIGKKLGCDVKRRRLLKIKLSFAHL